MSKRGSSANRLAADLWAGRRSRTTTSGRPSRRRTARRNASTSGVLTLWRWRSKYSPSRRLRGETLKAAMTLRRSRRSQAYSTGLWPRGAQVRRTNGLSIRPVSSRNRIVFPDLRAFFYTRPLITPPFLDHLLIPLAGLGLWFLATPSHRRQHVPHAAGAVIDAEVAADQI